MLNKSCSFVLCLLVLSCGRQQESGKEITNVDSSSINYGCCTPEITDTTLYSSGKKAPLFSGLDGIHFQVSDNDQAQKYFDQGLML